MFLKENFKSILKTIIIHSTKYYFQKHQMMVHIVWQNVGKQQAKHCKHEILKPSLVDG